MEDGSDLVRCFDPVTGETKVVKLEDIEDKEVVPAEDYRKVVEELSAAEVSAQVEKAFAEANELARRRAEEEKKTAPKTRAEARKENILPNLGNKYALSTEQANNGELFYQNEDGRTELAVIPDEIFDRIGIKPIPFKLTETMGWHVYDHYGKELKFNDIGDAIDFVLSIVNNVDHVRLGRDNSYIFSVEDGRNRVGKRAITIMIDSEDGKYMGIRTSGYETLSKLEERPLLWERGAETAPEDVATPTITTIKPQQGDEDVSRTKGQSNVSSAGKGSELPGDLQAKGKKNGVNGLNGSDGQPVEIVPGMEMEVDKDGEPEWDRATAEKIVEYLFQEAGLSRYEATAFRNRRLQRLQKAVKEHEGKRPQPGEYLSRYVKAKKAWEEKGAYLRGQLEKWEAVSRIMQQEELEQQKRVAQEETERKKIAGYDRDGYLSAEDYVMRELYGGLKLRWEDTGDGDYKMGGMRYHTGYGNGEKKGFRFLIDDKNGLPIETAAERLASGYKNEAGVEIADDEMRDVLLDVLGSFSNRQELGRRIIELHERAEAELNRAEREAADEAAQGAGFGDAEEMDAYGEVADLEARRRSHAQGALDEQAGEAYARERQTEEDAAMELIEENADEADAARDAAAEDLADNNNKNESYEEENGVQPGGVETAPGTGGSAEGGARETGVADKELPGVEGEPSVVQDAAAGQASAGDVNNVTQKSRKSQKEEEIKPVGRGVFGNIYDQFRGKAKEAVDFLTKNRDGDLLGVFHRKGVGDVDLIWGDAGGGWHHINEKHVGEGKSFADANEAAKIIDDIISYGIVDFENGDKIVFKKDNKLVTIRKNWREKGKKVADKNWVLTAYDETSADSESPIATNKSLAGSATSISEGKVSELSGNEQGKGKILRQNRQEEIEIGAGVNERLERMGIRVDTDLRIFRSKLKEAMADNSKEGEVEFFNGNDDKPYAFKYRGEIFINPQKADGGLGLHEYGHLWAEAFRRIAPARWKNVIKTLQSDAETWDYIKSLFPDATSDDKVASEMIAKFSGSRGKALLAEEKRRMELRDPDNSSRWGNIFNNIAKVLQDFWKSVGDFLKIEYKSPEQIYDQVVKDFANGMNPRERVRRYLKERDREYVEAVERGDNGRAKELFDQALEENVGNGITPFIVVGSYRGPLQTVAKKVKSGDAASIREAARMMSPLIPKDAVLVPAPSHTGRATDMLQLANAIGELTGVPVADVLVSDARRSQYDSKREGVLLSSDELGIVMDGEVPEGKIPVVIDNVVSSGNTAEACVRALGKGVVVSLSGATGGKFRNAASLRSAETVVRDKDGKVVPLSERFFKPTVKRQKVSAGSPVEFAPTENEVAVTRELTKMMGDMASMDWEEGQRVLDEVNGRGVTLSRGQKRAMETASVSQDEEHQHAVISFASSVNVRNNLESLAEKLGNVSNQRKNFIEEVANALGARRYGSGSQYATFETANGQIVTIRLADHNAHTSGFDHSGRDNGISVVISPKKNQGINNDGNAHVVEYYYDAIKLRRAEGKPLADIVRSIQQALYSGEYKDTTGLAEREEVNLAQARMQKVAPVFYSNAGRAVEGIRQEKATGEQWLAMLRKNGGLKAGEDKWLGLSDWLEERKGQAMTKQEVMDFIRENRVEIEEVNYSENTLFTANRKANLESEIKKGLNEGKTIEDVLRSWDEFFDKGMLNAYREGRFSVDEEGNISTDEYTSNPINKTRLDYTTEGLENKREIALTVPSVEPYNKGDRIHFGDAGGGRAVVWVRFGETRDADGKRVLVIDEVQSKRHQDGREKGYKGRVSLSQATMDDLEIDRSGDLVAVRYKPVNERFLFTHDQSDAEILKAINETIAGGLMAEHLPRVPDAPFDRNWHELAMKRMLRYAAENGYDKVAWTTGEQQAERYDIGERIDAIDVAYDDADGTYSVLITPRGGTAEDAYMLERGASEERLMQLIGKDLYGRLEWDETGHAARLEGDGLRIGGEGMKGFYDQMLPRFMDKYGKKWGVRTKDVELPGIGGDGIATDGTGLRMHSVDGTGLRMHSVDVTEEMKASVMEGQPMFFRTADGEAYGFTLDGRIYIDPRIARRDTPVHEFTHLWSEALERSNPEAWAHLKEELRKDGELMDWVRRLYPDIKDENRLMHEVFAHFSGKRGAERLKAEEERMVKEAGSDMLSVARIHNMFRRVRDMLTQYWQMARDLFAGNNERLRQMKAEDFADMAMADLLHPEMRNEELGMRNERENSSRESQKGKGEVRYSFIGEKGAAHIDEVNGNTRLRDNLERAKKMEELGERDDVIKTSTLWEKGADGKWRIEARDLKADVVKTDELYDLYKQRIWEKTASQSEEDISVETTLGELVDPEHNELLRIYPELADIRVVFKHLSGGKRGSFNSEEGTITIKARYLDEMNDDELNDVLVHEVQHAVQDKEGFASGGNLLSASDDSGYRGEIVARLEDKIKEYNEKIEQVRGNGQMWQEAKDAAIELYEQYVNNIQYEIDKVNKGVIGYDDAMDYYRRLAGETEARNVTRRRTMPAADRRSKTGRMTEDVGRDRQVVKFDSAGGAAMTMDNGRNDAHKIAIDDRVAQHDYLMSDNYVSSLKGDEFAKSDRPLTERVAQYYAEKYDGKVEREGVGTVLLDERSVKDSIAHGIGRNKSVAFAAVPDIIKNGAIIDRQENWKGRGRGSVTFAAPVEIGGKPYVGVVIAKEISHPDGSHRFYLHEVVLKENLLSEEFKTSSITGSKQGDVAKVLKEIVTAKEKGEKIFDLAKKRFGITYDLREAGYVLPDGKMLDFSGRHEGYGETGYRTVDHRDVRQLKYEADGNTPSGVETSMEDFVGRGAVRIDTASGVINLSVKPTAEQRDVLARLIRKNDGDVSVEIGMDGEVYAEYEGVNPRRVLADIDRYFDEGIKPEGNIRFRENGGEPVRRYKVVPPRETFESVHGEEPKVYGYTELARAKERGETERLAEMRAQNKRHADWMEEKHRWEREMNEHAFGESEGQYENRRWTAEGLGRSFASLQEMAEFIHTQHGGDYAVRVSGDGKEIIVERADMGSPWQKMLQRLNHTAEERRAFERGELERIFGEEAKDDDRMVEDEWRAMPKYRQIVNRLGLKVRFARGGEHDTERKRKAYGWYDTETGEIVINWDNHRSIEDVTRTLLHEAVGHKGLRELFGEDFGQFLDNVYDNVDAGMRDEIDAMLDKYDGDTREATEEFLSKFAERTNFDGNPSVWRRIYASFIDMLRKKGFNVRLTENDVRYILWKSHQALEAKAKNRPGEIVRAEDNTMRRKLGLTEEQRRRADVQRVAERGRGRDMTGQLSLDFEGEMPEPAAGRSGTSPAEQREKARQMEKLTDAELLERGGGESTDWNTYMDEYDRRHRDEYNEMSEKYLDILDGQEVSFDEVTDDLNHLWRRWRGGYKSEERTRLMAQMDALNEYVRQRFPERYDEIAESVHDYNVNIADRSVKNVVVDSSATKLPANRKEAMDIVAKLEKPFFNADQDKEISVSNTAIKHTAMQDHDRSDVNCLGVIDKIINKAIKIGEIPVKEDEIGHTHKVEVYYCPVNIDGTQYSARLVVKQYENRGSVLDTFQLYDLSSKKEKTGASSRSTGQNALTQPLTPVSEYKVTMFADANDKVRQVRHRSRGLRAPCREAPPRCFS